MLALRPPGDQHPAIGIDQGDRRDQKKGLFRPLFRSGSRH